MTTGKEGSMSARGPWEGRQTLKKEELYQVLGGERMGCWQAVWVERGLGCCQAVWGISELQTWVYTPCTHDNVEPCEIKRL